LSNQTVCSGQPVVNPYVLMLPQIYIQTDQHCLASCSVPSSHVLKITLGRKTVRGRVKCVHCAVYSTVQWMLMVFFLYSGGAG
jgi:hypothetical protein